MSAEDPPNPPDRVPDLSQAGPAGLSTLWPRPAGVSLPSPWRPQDLEAVLCHYLSVRLDQLTERVSSEATEADRVCRDLLISGQASDSAALRRLKDWAKPHMSHAATEEVPREVAGVIYFAAILSARLRLGERISDLSDNRLSSAARWAGQLPWLDAELAQLFHDAAIELRGDDVTRGPASAGA